MPEVRGAVVEVPLGVNRTSLDHHHVHWLDETPVVVGYLAKVAWNIILDADVTLFAVVAAEVPVVEGSVLSTGVGLDNRPWPHAQTSADAHVVEVADSTRQRPVECVGLGQHGAVVEPVTGSN